ncbi:MAG TPA: phosphohistidine phosphatase SixA [Gemmatimonadales bacterium]|nr:phosphohistidine phosphatase SixA [Gemmatimonadales bacterium]
MEVILVRHAKAENRDANTWPDDDQRPLTAEGRAEQRAATRSMKKMGIKFDFLVTSPLLRARETADILAKGYRWPEPPQVADELGHAYGAGAVVKLLAKFPPGATVALVGHEPDLSNLAGALVTRDGRLNIAVKKSGVVGIEFEGPAEEGQGTLLYQLKPAHLRKLAE